MHAYTYICTCFMRIHIYALNNNNKYASCTFAHYRRISRTHACPTIMYVSWMYLYVFLWCLVTRRTITQSNNAIIIIFICFYLIVVSLFVTFCDIHCNSLAEFVSLLSSSTVNTIPRADFTSSCTRYLKYRDIYFSWISVFKKNIL